MRQEPPDVSSNDALFAWSVRAHNAVNRLLDKTEMGIAEAKQFWESDNGQQLAKTVRPAPGKSPISNSSGKPRSRPCCLGTQGENRQPTGGIS